MPRSRKMGAFTLRQMKPITFGKSKRWPNQIPILQSATLMSIYRRVNSDASSGKRRAHSMAGTAKSFAREITLRFPAVLTKAQCHCASLILPNEVNAAFPYVLHPGVADPLVAGEIPRSGDDQAWSRGVEERVRAGFSGMMLTFD